VLHDFKTAMPWSVFPTKRPTISKTTLDLLLLFALLTLFYYIPFLHPRLMSYGGDGFSLLLPALEHYRRAVFNGIVPLWNPFTWMGSPFLASYQGGVLYPPQIIGLLFQEAVRAQNFGIFLSFIWLAYGSYFFGVRALRLERSPSLLMGIVMSCSAFVGAHTDHVNQLAAISWIPWILTEALVLLRRPYMRSVAWLAVCVCMQVLAGHPQYVIYTFTYLGWLIICFMVYYYHRRRDEDARSGSGIVLIVVGILTGLGLSAAQLLPSMELTGLSIRALDTPDRMFTFSFPPLHLITMLYANAFGNAGTGLHALNPAIPYEYSFCEFACFSGLITLVLAILAVVTLFREFAVRCFFLLSLLSLLAAFGNHVANGVPYKMMMMWYPDNEHIRVPARFLIFFIFSLVMLAAMGFNQVVHYLEERRRIRPSLVYWLRLLILVLVFSELFYYSQNQAFRFHDTVDILKDRGDAWSFFESNPGVYRVYQLTDEIDYHSDANFNRNETYRNRKHDWTFMQLQRFQPNLNTLGSIAVCAGYNEGLLPTLAYYWTIGMDTATQKTGRYYRNLHSANLDTELLGLMNVRYVMTDKYVSSPRLVELFKRQEGYDKETGSWLSHSLPSGVWFSDYVRRIFSYTLYENQDYLPPLVWRSTLEKAYDLGALGKSISSAEQKNFTYDRLVPNTEYHRVKGGKFVEFDRETAVRTSPTANRLAGSPNGLYAEKRPEESGTIVALMSAYPGWVCRYGKTTVPMRIVNPIMMEADLPKGTTSFEIVYEPYSFRLGLFISCCFVTMLCICAVFYDRPRDPHSIGRRLRKL
jgi:hypothetical protein